MHLSDYCTMQYEVTSRITNDYVRIILLAYCNYDYQHLKRKDHLIKCFLEMALFNFAITYEMV